MKWWKKGWLNLINDVQLCIFRSRAHLVNRSTHDSTMQILFTTLYWDTESSESSQSIRQARFRLPNPIAFISSNRWEGQRDGEKVHTPKTYLSLIQKKSTSFKKFPSLLSNWIASNIPTEPDSSIPSNISFTLTGNATPSFWWAWITQSHDRAGH